MPFDWLAWKQFRDGCQLQFRMNRFGLSFGNENNIPGDLPRNGRSH